MNKLDLLLVIGFVKYAHQVLYAVYLLQLKEYRYDRLAEHLKRKYKNVCYAWLYTCLGAPASFGMLPRPTSKTAILTLLSLALGGGILYWLGVLGIPLVLCASLGIVLASLAVTLPIEQVVRQRTYAAARAKIIDLKSRGLIVVGITGSYGKSSTKDFSEHILSSSFSVLATKDSINTPLGVARTILNNLRPSHNVFVVEMGAYKVGEIAELCTIALPDIGIITGISNQHLALFGSQDNIIAGKSELFDNLRPGSSAYINGASPHTHNSSNHNLKITYYSLQSLPSQLQKALQKTTLPRDLLINAVPSILIALEMGVSTDVLSGVLTSLSTSQKTMRSFVGRGGAVIVDDTRNTSEIGVRTAISYLSATSHQTKILVMPGIIELGPDEGVRVHRSIGRLLSESSIEAIVTTPDYFSNILELAPKKRTVLIVDTQEILDFLQTRLSPDTIIVLEGKIDPKITSFLLNKNDF